MRDRGDLHRAVVDAIFTESRGAGSEALSCGPILDKLADRILAAVLPVVRTAAERSAEARWSNRTRSAEALLAEVQKARLDALTECSRLRSLLDDYETAGEVVRRRIAAGVFDDDLEAAEAREALRLRSEDLCESYEKWRQER